MNQTPNTNPATPLLTEEQVRSRVTGMLAALRHAHSVIDTYDSACDDTQEGFRARRATVAREVFNACERLSSAWAGVRESVAALAERK